MCSPSQCSTCKKLSWSGCGQHVMPIFKNVSVNDRCFCGFTEEEKRAAIKNPELRSSMPKGQGCVIM